jgi:hypothetical protein
MTDVGARTNVDDTAARRSARDQWEAVAHREFRDARSHAQSEPGRTLEVLRKVLEAWAFALLSIQDPTFKPYKGDKPRKEQLAKALIRLSPQFPLAVRDAVLKLKPAADSAHHATSQLKIISPEVVQEMLRHSTTLLEYLDTQTDLPVAVEAEPIRQPGAAGRRRYVIGVGLGGVAVVGISATAWWLLNRSELDAKPLPIATTEPVADQRTTNTSRWVKSYEEAINSFDVGRVTSLMQFPMNRYFKLTDAPKEDVSAWVKNWFDRNPNKKTYFESCGPASVDPGGPFVVQCVERLDGRPANENHCLVFTQQGLLSARFKVTEAEPCRAR